MLVQRWASRRHAIVAGFAACGLAACGAASQPITGASAAPGAPTAAASAGTEAGGASTIDRAKLGSLTNYAYTLTVNGVTFSGRVHSPTDWESTAPFVVLHINGSSYAKVGATWYKNSDSPQAYAQSAYPGAAMQFSGFTRVSGATTRRGGVCTESGLPGHTWTIASPTGAAALTELASACIADGTGAL
ncbi:MAG TPA: hypothetical protein VMW49_08185, partial [Candidatus Dormibacteraeota bacterium]|nr:hypothetical protein [Candidatus Dormibacteraeota bacterium]